MSALDPEDRTALRACATGLAGIQGGLEQMESRFVEAIRGVHHRLDEVKEDSQREVDKLEERVGADLVEVRASVRRPALLSGSGAGAAMAIIVSTVKATFWPSP